MSNARTLRSPCYPAGQLNPLSSWGRHRNRCESIPHAVLPTNRACRLRKCAGYVLVEEGSVSAWPFALAESTCYARYDLVAPDGVTAKFAGLAADDLTVTDITGSVAGFDLTGVASRAIYSFGGTTAAGTFTLDLNGAAVDDPATTPDEPVTQAGHNHPVRVEVGGAPGGDYKVALVGAAAALKGRQRQGSREVHGRRQKGQGHEPGLGTSGRCPTTPGGLVLLTSAPKVATLAGSSHLAVRELSLSGGTGRRFQPNPDPTTRIVVVHRPESSRLSTV